jgi:glycosyltransferase involved in cell wall biosynthesis
LRGIKSAPVLRNIVISKGLERWPGLSVVVPACNEERAVGDSVGSVMAQEYPGELEEVVVDDRSSDRTGEILDNLAEEHPGRLRVLHVENLPEGWLGKNHALWLGASRVEDEWLLFTDADVWFSTRCFERAVGYAVSNGLHHLTLAPEIYSRTVLLGAFVETFELIFEITQRPWKARDPRSQEAAGVGAFNLLRRDVYEEIGTHQAIAMRPDDDMKLAKLVKKNGFRTDVAYGAGLLGVEWHQSLGGAVRGLSKSIFPGMDYRLDPAAFVTAVLLLTHVPPFVGVLLSRGLTRVLFGINVLLIFALYAYRSQIAEQRNPVRHAALHPFSVCVFVYAIRRSVYMTLANGGIEWRGTTYPLEQLKRNTV